ncbi:MAG TPA: disulfide bond formation protein B [Burkholderiaceae bacterium]|nr:disulfide bond formation protein B [Burkholderiaceae bacterium]
MNMPALSARLYFSLVAVIGLGLVGFGLVLQFRDGLEPCPLCILQRYAFVAMALFSAAAALIGHIWTRRILASLGLVSAAVGAGMAAWHVKLQLFPPEFSACGPGLAYLLTELPLGRALPRIFQGGGDCTEVAWRFLGLSIPAWALIWFVLLGIALLLGLRKTRSR